MIVNQRRFCPGPFQTAMVINVKRKMAQGYSWFTATISVAREHDINVAHLRGWWDWEATHKAVDSTAPCS